MKITSCRFAGAAYRAEDEPRAPGPDLVLFGRSNVGKSSLINRLLGAPGLARTSSQPGRTQSVNFYRVNERFHFVDLPGYGYAKLGKQQRRSFGPLIEGYLTRRRRELALGLLVVDARHAIGPLDRTMLDWLQGQRLPWVVAATKADKLSGNGRAAARTRLGAELGAEPTLFSAETGLGVPELWRRIDPAIAAWEGGESR